MLYETIPKPDGFNSIYKNLFIHLFCTLRTRNVFMHTTPTLTPEHLYCWMCSICNVYIRDISWMSGLCVCVKQIPYIILYSRQDR